MATKVNEILQFASQDTGSNLLTQTEYDGDAQRIIGHQPGIARSRLENKVLRQASLMSAGLAQFIVDNGSSSVTDSMSAQEIADAMKTGVEAIAGPVSTPAFKLLTPNVTFSPEFTGQISYFIEGEFSGDGSMIMGAAKIRLMPNATIAAGNSFSCICEFTLDSTKSTGATLCILSSYAGVSSVQSVYINNSQYANNKYRVTIGGSVQGAQWVSGASTFFDVLTFIG